MLMIKLVHVYSVNCYTTANDQFYQLLKHLKNLKNTEAFQLL